MQANIPQLEKRAIKLALKENWAESIEINNQILKEDAGNLKAKIRLGRAYLQTKEFKKAKKLFKEVLKMDPISKVALKNFELAKTKSTVPNSSNGKSKHSLIKKPGTTKEIQVEIAKNKITVNSLTPGDELTLKILKTQVKISSNGKQIATITDKPLAVKLKKVIDGGGYVTGIFAKGKEKIINVLIESSEPIFKSEKQNIKPYLKRGAIEEPKIELGVSDESTE